MKALVLLLLDLAVFFFANGQTDVKKDIKPFKEITVNFNTAALQSYLPFDEQFLLVGETSKDVTKTSVTLTVSKLDGKSTQITTETYHGKIVNAGADKSSISYIIDPIPPNVKVKLQFTFIKKISSLSDYTTLVRVKINQKMKELAEKGTFVPSDLVPLQEQLKEKLKTDFINYTPSWTGTVLDGNWGTSTPPLLMKLYNSYTTFGNSLKDLSDNSTQRVLIPEISSAINSKRIASLYQYFKNEKMEKAQYGLGKIIGSVDSDWIWIYLGQSYLDVGIQGPIAQLPIQAPGPTITVDDATSALKNIKKTMEGLSYLSYAIDTDVISNPNAMVKIKGSALVAGDLASMNTEFKSISSSLKNSVNLLKVAERNFDAIINSLNSNNNTLDAIVKEFSFTIEGKELLTTSTDQTFEVRGSWYISADAGIAFMPTLKTAMPYYGANIYFTPVNKNAVYTIGQLRKTYNLSTCGATRMWISKHLSLSIGIMPGSIANSQQGIDNLWSSGNLMTGVGLRLGRAFRIGYGGLIFRGYENNDPFAINKEIRASPYISASVDIDLLKFFGKVGDLIFK